MIQTTLELLPTLLRGARMTLLITLASAPLILVISTAFGFMRLSASAIVRFVATGYIEIFRGTSLVVQIFYLFYVLPLVGITLDPVLTGILALSLNYGAYGSEVVRSAILAVPRGQREAGIALGMPPRLTMRRIILPQAALTMLPPFGNMLIELLKSTSILSLITITELSFSGNLLFQMTGRPMQIFALVMILYFVMSFGLTRCVRFAERRLGGGRDMEFRS